MAKLTLTDVSSGYASTTLVNANNALIEAAFENTLSRDGTSPNAMEANLDMNSNNIVNLAEPTAASHAATKSYVDANAGGGGGGGISASDDVNVTGSWEFQADVSHPDGVSLLFGNSDDASISWDVANTLAITGSTVFTSDVEIQDTLTVDGDLTIGHAFSNDDIVIGHDGTDANFTFNNAEQWNITGPQQITVPCPISFAEISAAPGDTAGRGQLWVRDDTPCTLMFTDDAGNDTDLLTVAGGGIANVVEDTTPQLGGDLDANGNDITMGNDTGLNVGGLTITARTSGGDPLGTFFEFNSNNVHWVATPDTSELTYMEFDGGLLSTPVYIGVGRQITTQSNSSTGNTSGARIKSHDGAEKDIGFNTLDVETEDASDTLEAKHCGGVYFKDGTTAVTLTLEASGSLDFPVGGVCTIINANGTGDITVTEGSGTTLYYLDGTTRTDTAGGGTVGPGGIATLWREASDIYYIWGSGITA